MVELISAGIGGVLGVIVVGLWRATELRLGGGAFWPAYARIAKNLLTGAESEQFFRQYGELVRLLASYLAKTACRVAITILPVVLCLAALGPLAARRAAQTADRLQVYPPQRLTLQINQAAYSVGAEGAARLQRGGAGGSLRVTTRDRELELPDFNGSVAICRSPWTALGLQLLGFETRRAPQGPNLLILRAGNGDRNVCWPFLSDEEFAFWAAMLASSLAAAAAIKARRR